MTVKGYERSRSYLMARLHHYRWESLGESPELETVYLTPNDSIYQYAKRSHIRIILGDGIYKQNFTIEACDICIEAEHPGKAELLSEIDSTPVIRIMNTGFVDLRGMILGHKNSSTEDTEGSCGAGIIPSYSNFNMAHDLWGCGLNAVFLSNTISLTRRILLHAQELWQSGSLIAPFPRQ